MDEKTIEDRPAALDGRPRLVLTMEPPLASRSLPCFEPPAPLVARSADACVSARLLPCACACWLAAWPLLAALASLDAVDACGALQLAVRETASSSLDSFQRSPTKSWPCCGSRPPDHPPVPSSARPLEARLATMPNTMGREWTGGKLVWLARAALQRPPLAAGPPLVRAAGALDDQGALVCKGLVAAAAASGAGAPSSGFDTCWHLAASIR